MNKYEKPILISEEIDIKDIICVSSKGSTHDGVTVDFPKAGGN